MLNKTELAIARAHAEHRGDTLFLAVLDQLIWTQREWGRCQSRLAGKADPGLPKPARKRKRHGPPLQKHD